MVAPDIGDLVYLDFSPNAGHEQAGRRPGIVLSPQAFNFATGFAVVCPITNQKKGYPYEVELPTGSAFTGVILSDQIRSLDWRARRVDVKGQASPETIQEVLDKVHTYLP
ncbi:endoribonuclease MazF [Peribacillus frigoritolerans]|uniref:endoribonuclease MazF n=1 Tax=Peribacillus frigoritolerans TaxID=450367 RepID=UPI0021D3196E|nr:endoribonuclease MazF [Peribacillus frigoritolerans]MCU6603796.1 endoribonuclease MazF [Peribacillus frigoritolerans]